MRENVPDRTTTIEEKRLAMEYIEKILKSDASDDIKDYWAEKLTEIAGEIERLIGEQIDAQNNSQANDWQALIDSIPERTTTLEEKSEVIMTIVKILESNAPDSVKAYWSAKADEIQKEMAALQQEHARQQKH